MMIRYAVAALTMLLASAFPSRAATCPVYVLERQNGGIELVREELDEGGVLVYLRDLAAGTIDVVLPAGVGRSAGLLRASDRDRIIVRHSGGKLSVSVQRADGAAVDLPPRAVADLAREDVRVSVTLGDTLRRSFIIQGWRTSRRDDVGPAANMFAGQLPAALTKDAAIVQTETWSNRPASPACGRVPMELARWWFVRGDRPDGTQGWFIVDLAASESIVAKSWLPAGQAIEALEMVEHSGSGTRRLPYVPAGATGAVQSVVGSTTFASLEFGTARFRAPSLTVLEQLPDVFGRPVVGILGLDLLRGCDHLVLEFAADGKSATLALAPDGLAGTPTVELPYSVVSSHLMVAGSLEGARARWVLDSGSPGTVIDSLGAPAMAASRGGNKPIGGIDGQQTSSRERTARTLQLDGVTFSNVPCRVAPLPVFGALRESGHALGVLGASELARARAIDVDYTRGVVRWFSRSGK